MFNNSTDFDFDDEVFSSSNKVSAVVPTNINENTTETNSSTRKQTTVNLYKTLHKENDVNINNTTDNPPKISKILLKRKFPGPAGLLPERKKSCNISLNNSSLSQEHNDEATIDCTQSSIVCFEEGPWYHMNDEFQACNSQLLNKFNIQWIKKQASLNKLSNKKAPFLVALIQTLELSDTKVPTVNITLKDPSGSIQGTIMHNLYEEHSDYLVVGSVLVLKHFGVLTAGYNNNHYLTITSNNLLSIYAKEVISDMISSSNAIHKIKLHDFSEEEILDSYKEEELNTSLIRMHSDSLYNKAKINFHKLCINKSKPNSFTGSKSVVNVGDVPREALFKPVATTQNTMFDTSCDDLNLSLEDEFNIPDDFEEIATSQTGTIMNKASSSLIIPEQQTDQEILHNIFEGVDANDLFDDF